MPLSRTNRMDRRRQIIRDTMEGSEGATRPRKRRVDEVSSNPEGKRDAGYSQDVRKACQQRLVQLIPVRRSALITVLAICWLTWLGFVAAHYLIHIRGSLYLKSLPVTHLFHIREYVGIPRFLVTQLWMLTGIAALLIYQIRKHKLDDYRASYRIWLGLVAAAWFASLDSSTITLQLIGDSISPWTEKEFGYKGYAVVLATFASLVGVLGLRLCNELRVAKMSVSFWLGGLVAWGVSALFGTGILQPAWQDPGTQDLVVGSTWFAGTLAVFMSAFIYLRHIYLHAQKRFIQRTQQLRPVSFKFPALGLKRSTDDREKEFAGKANEEDGEPTEKKSKLRMPKWFSREDKMEREFEAIKAKRNQKKSDDNDDDEEASTKPSTSSSSKPTAPSTNPSTARKPEPASTSKPAERSTNPSKDKADQDTSDPVEKKKSWLSWGKKDNTAERSSDSDRSNDSDEDRENPSKPRVREMAPLGKIRPNQNSEDVADDGTKQSKKGWFSFGKKSSGDEDGSEGASKEKKPAKPKPERNQDTDEVKEKKGWFQRKEKPEKSKAEPADKDSEKTPRKGWFAGKPKSEESTADTKRKNNDQQSGETKKKGIFSFMDGLKLKPPVDEDDTAKPSGPKPVSPSRELPSTNSMDDDEEDDENDGRQLSRAERKKLRRDQANQRKAS